MDKSYIEQEVEDVLDNLQKGLEDETSKEYTIAVNNIAKVHKILDDERNHDLKVSREAFEREVAADRMKLDTDKLDFEKEKFDIDNQNRKLDREMESKKIEYQHEERMEEIKVNRIKAENEKKILEQNQIKADREYKSSRRRDILIPIVKLLGTAVLIVIPAILMHKDEINFERQENGLTPRRCSKYDDIMSKASEKMLG